MNVSKNKLIFAIAIYFFRRDHRKTSFIILRIFIYTVEILFKWFNHPSKEFLVKNCTEIFFSGFPICAIHLSMWRYLPIRILAQNFKALFPTIFPHFILHMFNNIY